MTVQFVLDCSVTAAWFFEDEFNPYVWSVSNLMREEGTTAVGPAIWSAEVANVLFPIAANASHIDQEQKPPPSGWLSFIQWLIKPDDM